MLIGIPRQRGSGRIDIVRTLMLRFLKALRRYPPELFELLSGIEESNPYACVCANTGMSFGVKHVPMDPAPEDISKQALIQNVSPSFDCAHSYVFTGMLKSFSAFPWAIFSQSAGGKGAEFMKTADSSVSW